MIDVPNKYAYINTFRNIDNAVFSKNTYVQENHNFYNKLEF